MGVVVFQSNFIYKNTQPLGYSWLTLKLVVLFRLPSDPLTSSTFPMFSIQEALNNGD